MFPLRITFTDFPPSEAISQVIEEKAAKLQQFYDRITSCEVFISAPHKHEKQKIYHVRVHLVVPGKELLSNREPEKNYSHHDVYIAIRDAFKAITRQLREFVDKRRDAEVYNHISPPHAKVIRIFPAEDYGFISTPDGRELYFHRNSVLDQGFEHLEVGSEVRFNEELGVKGPQVSSMSIVGNQNKYSPGP